MDHVKNSLHQEIAEEDEFVKSLIDSIAPKAYFGQDVLDYLEEKKCVETDSRLKELNVKKNLATKGKHKRAKLNPFLNQTVTQVINEIEMLSGNQMLSGKQKEMISNVENASVENLRERLKARIEAMQSVRHRHIGISRGVKPKKKTKQKREKYRRLNSALTDQVSPVQKKAAPKAVFNKEGKIVYSKFDLCQKGGEKKKTNLKKALKQAKKEENVLKKMEEENPERASEMSDKKMWRRALDKAEGVKMRDDIEMIGKSLKKKKERKKKSQKMWKERIQHVDDMQKQRQEKRKANIQARKKEKVEKKLTKAKKKGKLLPGF